MLTRLYYLLPSLLLTACATTDADSDGAVGAGGKADDAAAFQPTFCGVNILESAGPVFVGEVCIGTQRGPADALVPMLRVEYTDDKVELYALTEGQEAGATETVFAQRRGGEKHELTITTDDDADLPKSISGAVDRGLSFDVPLAAATPRVTCYMSRLSTVPGGYARIQTSLSLGNPDLYSSSNSIDAFDGSYSFNLYGSDDPLSFEVLFQENKHVQDETGSFTCSLEDVAPGTSFCKEPIIIDANLGIEDAEEREVHAFNFWCRAN